MKKIEMHEKTASVAVERKTIETVKTFHGHETAKWKKRDFFRNANGVGGNEVIQFENLAAVACLSEKLAKFVWRNVLVF